MGLPKKMINSNIGGEKKIFIYFVTFATLFSLVGE